MGSKVVWVCHLQGEPCCVPLAALTLCYPAWQLEHSHRKICGGACTSITSQGCISKACPSAAVLAQHSFGGQPVVP